MDQNTAFEIVKKYIKYLKNKKYNIHKAYIFGSYANCIFRLKPATYSGLNLPPSELKIS